MKNAVSVLLSLAILIVGCHTESALTKDELARDDTNVIYYLKDGSYIKSYSDHHHRVAGGYQVSGTIVKQKKNPEKFDGLVLDNEIQKFGVDELNLIGSLLGIGLAVAGLAVIISGFHIHISN